MTETLRTASAMNGGTTGFSPNPPCWAVDASFTVEEVGAAAEKVANRIASVDPRDDYDSDEPSPNTTKLLLESHTSTDGSETPKARWTRGPPPDDLDGESITSTTQTASAEQRATLSPQSLRSGRTGRSTSGDKPFVAWAWLLEDEGASEPKLQQFKEGETVPLPKLTDAERELLCEKTQLRLLEVGHQSSDLSALVEEYLRFMFLRKRLDGLLTLEPAALVNDVWHAHTACGGRYDAFCERVFGVQSLEPGALHGEMQPAQPVLYQNTVEAYEYFFGTCPPTDAWPVVRSVRADAVVKDEEAAVKVNSPCRRQALVRTA